MPEDSCECSACSTQRRGLGLAAPILNLLRCLASPSCPHGLLSEPAWSLGFQNDDVFWVCTSGLPVAFRLRADPGLK